MFKWAILTAFCALLILTGLIMQLTIRPDFSCESHFSILQNINSDTIRSDGIISVNMTDDNILIKIDGLLNYKGKKHIIARTLRMKYEVYNKSASLYKIISTDTFHDDSDNTDNDIANNLFFAERAGKNIIFIKRISDDVMLLGNNSFPQYGCGVWREQRPFSRQIAIRQTSPRPVPASAR